MGKTTGIEWADHTFNPWMGCSKVSSGCANCYAERNTKRFGKDLWGTEKERPRTSGANWKEPAKWNGEAQKAGERRRVFCASFADVGEDRPDLIEARRDLQILIEQTPMLDWLLLTKRPENLNRLFARWNGYGGWPSNVWAGTSVENQATADERIPALMAVPAAVRFLSCEPLLAPINLVPYLWKRVLHGPERSNMEPYDLLHWVIVGGESGDRARPMRSLWARGLRDQCNDAGVAFFFKQWGELVPLDAIPPAQVKGSVVLALGEDSHAEPHGWARIGKAAAGRLLDGREWSEFPKVPLV